MTFDFGTKVRQLHDEEHLRGAALQEAIEIAAYGSYVDDKGSLEAWLHTDFLALFREEIDFMEPQVSKILMSRNRYKQGSEDREIRQSLLEEDFREIATLSIRIAAMSVVNAETSPTEMARDLARSLRFIVDSNGESDDGLKDSYRIIYRTLMLLDNLFEDVSEKYKDGLLVPKMFGPKPLLTDRLMSMPQDPSIVNGPMLCSPDAWTSIYEGGRLTREMRNHRKLIGGRRLTIADVRQINHAMPQGILDACNRMQSVRLKIADTAKLTSGVVATTLKESRTKVTEFLKEQKELRRQLYGDTEESTKG